MIENSIQNTLKLKANYLDPWVPNLLWSRPTIWEPVEHLI